MNVAKTTPVIGASAVHRVALTSAAVAGAFVLLVVSVLLNQFITATTNDPWKSPQLLEAKERLRAAPKDEAVKARIRDLDLRFREDYRRRLRLAASGGWLLVAGTAVLVLSLQAASEAKRQLPLPRPDPDAAKRAVRTAAQSRRAVAVAGALAVVAMVSTGLGIRSLLGGKLAAPGASAAIASGAAAAVAPAVPLPPPAEFARNWPRFRGPDGGGLAPPDTVAPLTWDAKSGAGVIWKSPVPAAGFNSPIVWNDRVFLSGATKEKREVLCFDARDGRLLWTCAVPADPRGPGNAKEPIDDTGYAASTMATDGRNAFVIFGNGTLAAVTFDGKVAWTKHLGMPNNAYGHATSLAVWQDRVIVQYDQGTPEAPNSKIVAFDGLTGRVAWETARKIPCSWATPIVFEAAGKAQIVTLGEPHVIAYDASNGAELWRVELMHGEIAPSPVFAGGRVLVVNPTQFLAALKPDGSGDVTASHVAWKVEGVIPDVVSPVSDGEFAFVSDSGGVLTCFEAATGKQVWEKDLQAQVQASPVIVGKRLYVCTTAGTMFVIEVAREFRQLARNELGEKFFASPALAGGRMFLRGDKHLFCLGVERVDPNALQEPRPPQRVEGNALHPKP
ncbi:MAG: PQQ-binding-like beta-propeller repeat protein [Verrucomicrobia bacterium]|nr:PQQ-binding-like beta-propeller repeat protein [Verrucomicrobiota bacterium]